MTHNTRRNIRIDQRQRGVILRGKKRLERMEVIEILVVKKCRCVMGNYIRKKQWLLASEKLDVSLFSLLVIRDCAPLFTIILPERVFFPLMKRAQVNSDKNVMKRRFTLRCNFKLLFFSQETIPDQKLKFCPCT